MGCGSAAVAAACGAADPSLGSPRARQPRTWPSCAGAGRRGSNGASLSKGRLRSRGRPPAACALAALADPEGSPQPIAGPPHLPRAAPGPKASSAGRPSCLELSLGTAAVLDVAARVQQNENPRVARAAPRRLALGGRWLPHVVPSAAACGKLRICLGPPALSPSHLPSLLTPPACPSGSVQLNTRTGPKRADARRGRAADAGRGCGLTAAATKGEAARAGQGSC